MNHARLSLYLLLSFLCHFHYAEGKSDMNPCHSHDVKSDSSNCEVVTMPIGFCSACTIGPIYRSGDLKGQFVDCERAMDVETDPSCLSLFESYVNLNPCDTARARAIEEFKSSNGTIKETGRLKLDYFTYAMCEQGCDCIPQVGAVRENRVFDFYRGNCQAHAWFDVCDVLPNIKLIRLNGTDDNITGLPRVRDLIWEWFNSSASENWRLNPRTTVHDDVKYFLERMLNAIQLVEDESYWNACFDMEWTQNRIAGMTDSPTPTPTDFSILKLEVWNTDDNSRAQALVDWWQARAGQEP